MNEQTIGGYTAEDVRRLARLHINDIENPRYREEFQYVCDLKAKQLEQEQQRKRNGNSKQIDG
jgi:hypothetical protein